MKREKVHTVDVYWDGPIAGAADFGSIPHYFDVVEDDVELADGSLNFMLIAIPAEILQLIKINDEIRQRWQIAFNNGEADLDSEPALPEDREQLDRNRYLIDNFLFQNRQKAFISRAIFYSLEENRFEVEWI